MNELDHMLDLPPDTALSPLVRFWRDRVADGDQFSFEIQPPETATPGRNYLILLHSKTDEQQQPKQFEWDDELNAELVSLGVRAKDFHQESTRFALAIRAALQKAEQDYGDGLLNSVLVDLIDDSHLGRTQEIAEVRMSIHPNPSQRRSKRYPQCRERIADEIGARAVELRDKLNYSHDQVKQLMQKALAKYLDQRFSVSSRRQLER